MQKFIELHACKNSTTNNRYGHAIRYCYELPNGLLFAGNDEYESAVAFCPVCGTKAKLAPPEDYNFTKEDTKIRKELIERTENNPSMN